VHDHDTGAKCEIRIPLCGTDLQMPTPAPAR